MTTRTSFSTTSTAPPTSEAPSKPAQLSAAQQQRRHDLRLQLKQQRLQLSSFEQRNAALRLARNLARHPCIQAARRIALYVGYQGELDPWRFHHLWSHHKRLYLPVLYKDRSHCLHFVETGGKWTRNRFGISEPAYRSKAACPLGQLDLLLMPLVAFDTAGGRLGMGGGFYDRTLALQPSWSRQPYLLGVGYQFQQVDTLPTAPWDKPVNAIITD